MARWPRSRAASFAPARLARRLVDLLGPTGGAARQSLVVLALSSLTSVAAGLMLVGMHSTFERLPGLIVLVTPAIGLRGNVFSTMGNRLSTAIHAGTYSSSTRRDTVLGQNLLASFSLTILLSVILAVMARVIGVAIGVEHALSTLDLLTISVAGGLLGSVPVAIATILLARGAVRYGWDLDNLVAPAVETLGDVLTVPSLWLATTLIGHGSTSAWIGGALAAASLWALVGTLRSRLAQLRQIVLESIPVLTVALFLSALAGLVLQKQLALLDALPAILALQPAFVSSAGALGSILSGRLSTELHLGLVQASMTPDTRVRSDVTFVLGLTVPIMALNAVVVWVVETLSTHGHAAPGLWWTLFVSIAAASIAMVFVLAISYYATVGAWHVEVDPDSYGVPILTAATDFIGTMTLILLAIALHLA
jgi:mgtE-like transporter